MSDPGPAPWRHLHPASLLTNLLPHAGRTLRGAWPLLLALAIGGGRMGMNAVDATVFALFGGLTLASTVAHWATLRYRVRDGRLEIASGMVIRRRRTIDPDRIQNIELVRNVLHKLTGLVELRIETAGDVSTEGLLSALSVAEAERLRDQLRAAAPATAGHSVRRELARVGPLELAAYGFSARRVGTVALLVAVVFEVAGIAGPDASRDVARAMRPGVLIAGLLIAWSATWAFSALSAVVRHHRFRLEREGDRLVAEEGLATRRRVEIPLDKVQLVRADEPLLRRWLGYGTLSIETAGLGVADGRLRQAEAMVPMVASADLAVLAVEASPAAGIDPWTTPLRPPHRRALRRACIAGLGWSVPIAAGAVVAFGTWGLSALSLVALSQVAAWLDWKRQGWLVTDTAIVSRRGFFSRETWIVARDKLQSAHVHQGPFLRWNGLARPVVCVAGTVVALPDIGEREALAVLAELVPAR